MPLNYFQLDKSEIKDIIISEDFRIFKNEIEERFNIQRIEYDIETQDIAYGEGGYAEPFTNARTIFNNGYEKVDRIVFYSEDIKEAINRKFSRLSSNMLVFNRVIEIYVKATLIHELVHIQQFQNGRLTEEVMNEEKQLPYERRHLEMEANSMANEVISNWGEFESNIAEYIYSNISVNNDSASILFELFSNEYVFR
ncbi:hypothetical protein G9F71_000665 [Clostridium sp. FP2]|uniref:hypothetical protein n=1 Tax=Clostridium sp. FP2 TaxID=2724481 RepID=UPI0013E98D60|nr:hypothetical protein [Clostridium sp. FP2]MBZ9621403.1 hypothetical protein [Clostridium sp. FP2]